jgi:hypothetical protein
VVRARGGRRRGRGRQAREHEAAAGDVRRGWSRRCREEEADMEERE